MASLLERFKKLNTAPIVRLHYSYLDIAAEVISLLALLFNYLVLWFYWSSLPDSIPVHFNFTGEPDRTGSRSELLVLQFLIAAAYLLLTIVSRFPRWYHYAWKITPDNAARQYSIARSLILWLKVLITCGMAYTTWSMIRIARGKAESLGFFSTTILLILVFVLIVTYLVKAAHSR